MRSTNAWIAVGWILWSSLITPPAMAQTPALMEIDAACAQYKMTRHQALSLRRQLQRAQPNGMQRVEQGPMGSKQGQRSYAQLFEVAVEKYLRSQGVPFLSQNEQLIINKAAKPRRHLPTPDILFTRYSKQREKKITP